jgi:hypothetical protein
VRRDLHSSRNLGLILDDTFALYREHLRTLLTVAAIVVIPVEVGVLGIGLGWLWEGYDSSRPLGDTAVAGFAQLLLVTPLVTAMVVHVLVETAGGRPPAVGSALRFGFEAFGAVFLAVVLAWLGVLVGIVAFIVPGLICLVRWSVVPQTVVVEGQRGGAALRRSWELVTGRSWWVFGVVLVLNLVASVLAGIVTIPASYLADSADAQGLVLAGAILGQLFTVPLVALGTTLLFFSLRAGPGPGRSPHTMPQRQASVFDPITHEESVPAAPPDPDDPWERRRREGWEPPGAS